jgi:hypothetical protein
VELTITEVTEMSPGIFCVAGWCAVEKRMVRPLPNGSNWSENLLAHCGVVPGATIAVVPIGAASNGAYPHRTEDQPIDASKIKQINPGPGIWFGPSAPPAGRLLATAFEGNVEYNSTYRGCLQGVFVPLGTQTQSLGAVLCSRRNLSFVEEFDKLKIVLTDDFASYKLVT